MEDSTKDRGEPEVFADNEECEIDWAGAFMQILTDKDFVKTLERTVNEYINYLKDKNRIEMEHASNWKKITGWYLVYRFVLSFIVLIGLGFALKMKLLPNEVIAALLTAIVASLFVPPRKE